MFKDEYLNHNKKTMHKLVELYVCICHLQEGAGGVHGQQGQRGDDGGLLKHSAEI